MALFGGRKRRTWATPEELLKQRMSELTDLKQAELDKFKEQLPQFQAQQISDARRNFAGQMRSDVNALNAGANRGGMLYSGRRAAGEAGIRGNAALGLAQEKDAIAKRLNDQVSAAQTDITNQRYGLMTNSLNEQIQGVADAQARSARQNAQLGGLMQAGGYAAGSMNFGGGGSSPQTMPTSRSITATQPVQGRSSLVQMQPGYF